MKITGNIPMDELAPDVQITLPDSMPVTDADGNKIGEVTHIEHDEDGLQVEADLFAEAAEVQKMLAAKRVDDLIIAGAKNAAEILDNPNLQERTAMEAVARVMGVGEAPQSRQPGPARRSKKRPTKRQRTKAARKSNR